MKANEKANELIALVTAFFDYMLPAMSDPATVYVIRYSVGSGACSVTEEREPVIQLRLCKVCKKRPCHLDFDHCGAPDCIPF